MNTYKKALLFILSFLPLLVFSTEKANPKTIALLIGVGDYNEDTSWDDLNSEYDLLLIKEALMTQGVPEKGIFLLKSKAATRNGILEAIRTKLIQKAKKGGTVIFHFSGHGQQIHDDNGDELDGYDEALVPVNSKKHFEAGVYEGENLIRDDELEALFNQIRQKLGPKGHFLVTMDACHSGTGTRGFVTARGTDVIMANPDYIEQREELDKASKTRDSDFLEKVEKKNLAPMIAFFSSSARQLSYEYTDDSGTSYGLMSFAFSKALKGSDKATSYQELFDNIKMQVSAFTKRQTPQAEGQLNQGLFNGKATGKPEYFLVKEKVSAGLITVKVGKINKVYENSTLAFYPLSTRNTASTDAITTGKVIYSGLLECDVELKDNIPEKQILQSRAFIREQNYGNLRIKVKLDIGDESFESDLSKALQDVQLVQVVEKEADLQIQSFSSFAGDNDLQIVMPDGFPIFEKKLQEEGRSILIGNIKRELLTYAQSSFLRKLEVDDEALKVKVEFVTTDQEEPIAKDNLRFKVGQEIKIKITNSGSKACYFSVFNIQSDHVINAVIPWDRTAEEYFLEPGEHYLFEHSLTVEPPSGLEILKIILTPKPINLRRVIQSRGASSRGQSGNHPLEVLISQSFLAEDSSRGNETINIPDGSVGVQTVVFEIVD